MLALFVGFGLASVVFWAIFALRGHRRPVGDASEEAPR
jgi:hypothetical protein